jgi:GT2 family glycosyltransferase
MSPSVSVIIPTFNRLPLLQEAVASVFGQTHADWELIVVDDGSADETAAYVCGLSDHRIHLLTVPHCGRPAKLRNLGIARASGAWVAFLDSDDVWMPRKLEDQLQQVVDHPGCGWSYTNFLLIDEKGAELPRENYQTFVAYSGSIIRQLLVHDALIACPSVLASRALLQAVGGFDESLAFSEDYDLWLRLAVESPVEAVSRPLCKVRLHPGSNTRHRPEVNQAFIQVYTKFLRDNPADRQVLGLCDRQRAFYWLHYGRQMWQRGEHARGVAALARAFLYQPTHPEWWRAVTKKVVLPILPARMVHWYRQRRGPVR